MRCATSLIRKCVGEHRCFYCGNAAREALSLSSAFCDWWTVAFPDSKHICDGCVWMLDEKRVIAGKDKPQKTRNYSWLVTRDEQRPFTKANKSEILDVLLSPPEPPWALALAESGQKHILYRTAVNATVRDGAEYVVDHETY